MHLLQSPNSLAIIKHEAKWQIKQQISHSKYVLISLSTIKFKKCVVRGADGSEFKIPMMYV